MRKTDLDAWMIFLVVKPDPITLVFRIALLTQSKNPKSLPVGLILCGLSDLSDLSQPCPSCSLLFDLRGFLAVPPFSEALRCRFSLPFLQLVAPLAPCSDALSWDSSVISPSKRADFVHFHPHLILLPSTYQWHYVIYLLVYVFSVSPHHE